ncbi:MAG: RpiB/LacA/LacB family sugar-phosphate isomerase [Elusimicrobia bacterium]|nr:RpiB/LacA/LacB family sugar-phosphate isomerase [Elusimicrobiota bacterium]
MKISLGADHAGFPLKGPVAQRLRALGHEILDVGTDSLAACDYPDFALEVARAVAEGRAERGVMVCGSGVGAAVAVNKVPGARGSVCHDTFSARQGVEDDDLNILCLGARIIGESLAMEVLEAWLKARFSDAQRHTRRRDKVTAIEKRYGSKL